MQSWLGAFRRAALAPSMAEPGFRRRGFGVPDSPTARHLESIPRYVVLGFEFGMAARRQEDAVLRLGMVEREFRGFAYEGTAMALSILDATAPRAGTRLAGFLAGPAAPHLLLSYIGVGFAMARLPRVLWPRIRLDGGALPQDPTLGWLVVDGYGFDLAYFRTRRWVQRREVPSGYPWLGSPGYFGRAVDQGIGRALWFIGRGDARSVAAAVAGFGPDRRPDLWSGIGLAATYAGAGDADALAALRPAAGRHLPELAQGAVFAATARVQGGLSTPHTELATRLFCGLDVAGAVELGRRSAPAPDEDDALPRYETWRRRVQAAFG